MGVFLIMLRYNEPFRTLSTGFIAMDVLENTNPRIDKNKIRIKELEIANQKLQEINSVLLDSTLEPMLIAGLAGNYINANFATKSLLKLSETELQKISIKESNNINNNLSNTLSEVNPDKTLRVLTSTNNFQEISYVTKTEIGQDLLLYILHDPAAMLSLSTSSTTPVPATNPKPSEHVDSTSIHSGYLFETQDDAPSVLFTFGKWVYDLTGKNDLVWSREACNIFGVNKEDFDSNINSFFALVHPEDLALVKQTWQKAVAQTRGYRQQYRIIKSSGEIRWVKDKAKLVVDQEGNALQLEGYYQDITDTKVKEERLNQQAALLDVVQNAIIVCDNNGIVSFWNKFASHLYGWDKSEAIGKHLADLVKDKDKSQWENCYKILLAQGVVDQDLQHYSKNGHALTINSHWNIMNPENNNSILIVNTDITEKKKLEANFLRVQRMESIGALAGGIAHDLNNMLSPILMSVQILKKKNVDPLNQKILSTLESTVQRGADLVRQILSFSRGFEGKNNIIDVKQIVNEIEKLVREIFPRSIHFTLELEKGLWPITGDPTQIHQILLNLCVNSRDAMPNGGLLKLSLVNVNIDKHYAEMRSGCAPGRYILISSSDNGQGIAPEDLDKIFDPFFTTKESGKGTGLGLSTVMSIVKSYHGFINVFSEVNKGTVFNIYLPVTETITLTHSPVLETVAFLGNGELILVIDDESAIREITKSTLEVHNYNVITASDGIDGLTTYVQNKDAIKLVITDIMMPHMDGVAVVRALQKVTPDVKIIPITGLSSFSREPELSSLGVKKILAKPYTADILLSAISDLLTSKTS